MYIRICLLLSLDSDQDRLFFRPNLGPNCLQRLSADDTSVQRGKVDMGFGKVNWFYISPYIIQSRLMKMKIFKATFVLFQRGHTSC